MFDRINIEALEREWKNFRKSNEYKGRMEQTKFCRVAKLIIEELVKKKKIKNDHLTALIQMFAWNCSEDNFNKYLGKLEFASGIKKKILDELNVVEEKGYTGRGKAVISELNEKQLAAVKNLLKFVLEAQNVEQVKDAIKEFRKANIPYVKVGIYSPWLYYVKPNICPLVTSKRKTFLKKLGWKDEEDYIAAIDLFIEMSKIVGEKDLGLLDAFLEDEDRQNKIIKKNKNDTPSDDAHDNRNLDAIFNAIYTKPFIILSGISGTGKTQIARIISAGLIDDRRK